MPPQAENFHLVGLMNPNFNGTSPAARSSGTPTPKEPQGKSKNKRTSINLDDNDDVVRVKTKRYWTHDDEVELAKAWLKCSKDSLHGNEKKSEAFWAEIAEEYNNNVPKNRKSDINQMKIHWTHLKASISDFNGFWTTVTKLHTIGYSDDQLMDEAQKLYAQQHGKPFTLVHWSRTLKSEPKWMAWVARLEKDKNKSVTNDVTDDKDQPCPMGREAAKAQLRGKRKKEEVMQGIVLLADNINKIVEVQKERTLECEKVSKTQLEISRTNLKAAKEQKQARLLEVYNSLLKQDTSMMTELAKASREKTLIKMEPKLFGSDDDDDSVA